jgi:gas vesicle protein
MGSLVGATLALLLTPVSGDDLRGQLQSRSQNFRAELKNAAASRRSELEAQLAELRKPLPKTEM